MSHSPSETQRLIEAAIDKLQEALKGVLKDLSTTPEPDRGTAKVTVKSKPTLVKDIPVEASPVLSLDDVSTAIRETIRVKGRDVVVTLLKKYKATKASEVAEGKRHAIIDELKEIMSKDG